MLVHLRFASLALLLPISLLAQTPPGAEAPHLIPMPRELQAGAVLPIARGVRVVCSSCSGDAEDRFTAQDLESTLAARSVGGGGAFTVTLTRVSTLAAPMTAEGYTISPGANGLTIAAVSAAGLFYGAQTVKQLIEGEGANAIVHLATIKDWPAMKYRGLHDDLSRGPVPTLAFQKHLIEQLAAYKVNVYSPYFESTQQYSGHPLTATPGGSISAADAQELVAYAQKYHITVIPEQEAIGHLRHLLLWEQYQGLAETPHGAVLTPLQPGSIALIKQMFTELAALYPGPFLHIGADETIDLGVGATKARVDDKTLPVVYLDYLQQIVTALAPLHRKVLFWGDVAQGSPGLLKAMPRAFKDQTIAVAWGYSPDPKGFAHIMKPYSDAGIEVWAAPSINNYRQVYPNQAVGLEDIQQYTSDAQRGGATGQLNTLWNDDGESLANQNWYGILFGAAAAWQQGTASIPAFQQAFAQVFHGDRTGLLNQAQLELTAAMSIFHDSKVVSNTEGTDGLFWIDPWNPTNARDGQLYATRMRPISAQIRLRAEAALTLIAQARAATPTTHAAVAPAATLDGVDSFPYSPTGLRETDAIDAMELGARRIDFLALKFQLADEMSSAYARAYTATISSDPKLKKTISRELSDINGVNGRMQDLINGYAQLRDLYAQAWLRTNRPANLRQVLQHYDLAMHLWQQRADKVRTAQRQYSDLRTLPQAVELGIPAPSVAVPTAAAQ